VIRGVLAAFCLAAAGCGSSGERPPGPSPRPPATATPTAPRARSVHFRAADRRRVTGEYTAAGTHAPALVLLHEIRGGPDQWSGLVPYLHAAGFATLAYQSRFSPAERDRLPDALAAVRWLRTRRDVDPQRLGLVGASIGASTAVLAMATGARRTVDAAVALSPPDTPDVWTLQDRDRYHPHDLLLISDTRESASAKSMLEGAARSRTLRSAGPGHGVALLAEAKVRDALVAWLEARVAG
jgi:hypothetical protein